MKKIPALESMVVALLLASACASSPPLPASHRPPGAIDMSRPWPVPGPSPFGALGGHVDIREHVARAPDIEAYLKPQRRSHESEESEESDAPRPTAALTAKAAPVRQHAFESPGNREATPVLVARSEPASTTSRVTSAAQEPRYAAREQSAQAQKEFRGGDVIVIGAGTLVIVLLVVLLILLLN